MNTMERLKALWRRQRQAARAAGRPRRMGIYSKVAGGGALVCAALMVGALADGDGAGAGIYLTVGGLLALLAIFLKVRRG